MKIILDTNIYDKLDSDINAQVKLKELTDKSKLVVIVTRTIFEELEKSPFGGIPSFFKTKYIGNTVSRSGLMCSGDSLGSGVLFDAHLGKSTKINDALIVDAADLKADYLISEDKRLKSRMARVSQSCQVLSYSDFVTMLNEATLSTR
jgi:predicted nucleic acid-binding protein